MSLLQNGQREVTSEFGCNQIAKPFFMPKYPQANNVAQLRLNKDCCSLNTQKENSFRMLVLDSTSGDVALSPYWNERCQGLQSNLFLPHQIESPVRASRLSRDSSNYMEVQSNFWRKTYTPKDLTYKLSLAFSLASATHKAGKEQVNVARKIRVYPSEPQKVDRQISVCRRAYNLCVATYREWVKGDSPIDFSDLRRNVRGKVRQEAIENGWEICITSLDEACQEVKRANQAVIRKRVMGQKAELQFRKKTTTKQGFIYQKLSSMGLPKVLGDLHLT